MQTTDPVRDRYVATPGDQDDFSILHKKHFVQKGFQIVRGHEHRVVIAQIRVVGFLKVRGVRPNRTIGFLVTQTGDTSNGHVRTVDFAVHVIGHR